MERSKQLILIVDDNVHNLQVLGNILQNEGYNIAVAEGGEQALLFIEKKNPHLILLDVVMPGLDGIEVCKILKSKPITKDIPVIFISVHKDTSEKLKAFMAGGVDYITKPFQKEEVLARVNVHLELKMAKERLKKYSEELEVRIKERTKELLETNKKLEEMNIALKVLLEKKEEDKDKYVNNLVFNVKHVIEPYLDKLKQTPLTPAQHSFIHLIEKNLDEIINPFQKTLTQRYGLTPTELQVLELIRSGKMTKEVAEILNLSKRTVDTHRHNIRKKLGILNKNISLLTYLSSIEKDLRST